MSQSVLKETASERRCYFHRGALFFFFFSFFFWGSISISLFSPLCTCLLLGTYLVPARPPRCPIFLLFLIFLRFLLLFFDFLLRTHRSIAIADINAKFFFIVASVKAHLPVPSETFFFLSLFLSSLTAVPSGSFCLCQECFSYLHLASGFTQFLSFSLSCLSWGGPGWRFGFRSITRNKEERKSKASQKKKKKKGLS